MAAAPGTHDSAPVHANFPFDDPLVPAVDRDDLFSSGRVACHDVLPGYVRADRVLSTHDAELLAAHLESHNVIVLAGEGTLSIEALGDQARRDREVQALLAFSERFDAPLLADPLSQLRSYGHPAIICGYDQLMGEEGTPSFDTVIRFGRYPISKRATQVIESAHSAQIVVDVRESRDFNAQTTTFIQADPLDFVTALLEVRPPRFDEVLDEAARLPQAIHAWGMLDRERTERLMASGLAEDDAFEGAYVQAILDEIPSESLLFSANSMAVRAIDSFYFTRGKRLTVLANRGLNGIDGTLSTAIGAAQEHEQTVFLTGDLTLLHDLNALALQGEMLLREREGARRPSIVVVLLNNQGGAIFDMLPQCSDEPYFERLFLTPQQLDFCQVARAFGIPAEKVDSISGFRNELRRRIATPGISLIEVPVALRGVKERYGEYR